VERRRLLSDPVRHLGIGLYAPPAFLVPLQEHFGWSRTSIDTGSAIAAVVSAMVSPLVGAWLDEYGSRKVMTFGAPLMGSACPCRCNTLLKGNGAGSNAADQWGTHSETREGTRSRVGRARRGREEGPALVDTLRVFDPSRQTNALAS
jgi:hypothetical protein